MLYQRIRTLMCLMHGDLSPYHSAPGLSAVGLAGAAVIW